VSICAIILAAGKGTRMKSSKPKVLHEVLGRPMIGHVVGLARSAGSSQTVVVVGHEREAVEGYLTQREPGEDLRFAVQTEQLGTAHAVLQAREALAGHTGLTLILSGDVPNMSPETLRDFIEVAGASKAPVSFVSILVPDPTGYGRIVRDEAGEVTHNVEHRDATDEEREIQEINAGIYLVDNAFLWEHLSDVGAANAQREFYLPDLFVLGRAKGGLTAYRAPDHREFEGINNRAQLAMAERFARTRRNEALMVSGVTMIDPETVYIDAFVEVAQDVLFEPNVRVTGRSSIGAGSVLRQGSVVEDSLLEAGVTVMPHTHVEASLLRAGASVGPFAHVRPGCDIGQGARVGNFVETKNTTLGAGTKASHLSYLGDATVGKECNVGAGTITCNYDGAGKHPTVVGDRVFLGSNSALVAPVKIGDGAYIGAGSTITKDVPQDGLGVARGRQRNIEGWVPRFRKK